jgi:hypothetical protein
MPRGHLAMLGVPRVPLGVARPAVGAMLGALGAVLGPQSPSMRNARHRVSRLGVGTAA